MEILVSIRSKTDDRVRDVKRAIGDGLVVGRGAEEGILLDGTDLSREHLVLTTDGTNVYVSDLSVNGTWVNGARLRQAVKSKVRAEDSIEVPGYVLTVRPAQQPEEVRTELMAQPSAQLAELAAAAAKPKASGPMALLAPVFHFVGSFTFLEKTMFAVAVCGLLLLYAYMGT